MTDSTAARPSGLRRRERLRRSCRLMAIVFWLFIAVAGGCKREAADPTDKQPTRLELLKKAIRELPVPESQTLPPVVREQFDIDYAAASQLPQPRQAPAAAFNVARLLHGQGYAEFARDWYEFALSLLKQQGFERFDHDEFLCWYYLADLARQQEMHDEALKAVQAALSFREDDPAALLLRADLIRRLNQVPAAPGNSVQPDAEVRKAYEKALARREVAPAWYGLGCFEASRQRVREAEDCFRRALALAPDHLAARRALAELLTASQREPEARDLLEAAAGRGDDPGYADPYLQALHRRTSLHGLTLAHLLRLAQAGKAEEAEAELRLLLLSNTDDAASWDLLGTIINAYRVPHAAPRYRPLLLAEAKRCLLAAIQKDAAFLAARYNYAKILMDRDRNRDAALEQLREIVVRDDTYWLAHYEIAEILFRDPIAARRSQNLQRAEEHYRKVIVHDPDNMHAYSGLIALVEEQGRYEEAHKLLQAAVLKSPDDPGIADQMARFLLDCPLPDLRDVVKALTISERVNEIANRKLEFPEYLETLARAYVANAQLGQERNVDNLVKAYEAIRKALDSAAAQDREDLLPRLRDIRTQIEGMLREAGRLPK